MSGSGARAALRIARRNIARSRWRSLLVVMLILLPVAAMVGAGTLLATVTPSPDRQATERMGRADLIAYPLGPGSTVAAIRAFLPPDSTVEPITGDEGDVVLPGEQASVIVWSMDLDGLAHGMLTVLGGRLPSGPAEVAISEPVATLTHVEVGGRIMLSANDPESGPAPVSGPAAAARSVTVVGLVEDPLHLDARILLVDPSTAVAAGAQGQATLLVGLPTGAGADALAASGLTVTPRAAVEAQAGTVSAGIIVLGGLALVEAALVASAAFAVSIRRHQRELGLLAAAGAEPRHLAGTVLAQGLVLGGVGALVGAAVGFTGALVFSPWLDALTNQRNPPVAADPVLTVAAMAIGLLATLVAAAVPAWTAAHVPVLSALSGRRPPRAPARRMLMIGLVLIGLGVAATASGSTVFFRSGDGSTSALTQVLLLGGAVVGTLGFGACSPWLLEHLEPLAARLPLAGRVAVRDTARARSRTAPVVTAVLAAFAATVALSAFLASSDAAARAHWQPWLRADQILVRGRNALQAGPAVAAAFDTIAAGPIVLASSGGQDGTPARYLTVKALDGPPDALADSYAGVAIADPELLRALGAEAATDDLLAGDVVLLTDRDVAVTRVAIEASDDQGTVVQTADAPARVVDVGVSLGDVPGAAVSAATAARLGVVAPAQTGADPGYLVRLDHPVTADDQARAAAVAAQWPDTFADVSRFTSGNDAFRLAMLAASLLFALAVTGVAVALGEAEARPDQRVLLALGADPRVRRRIAAARAGVVAGLAGILAVPAGLLPVWGLLASRGSPLAVPVPEILAALVVLPLAAVVATFLLARPIPAWSTFRGARS